MGNIAPSIDGSPKSFIVWDRARPHQSVRAESFAGIDFNGRIWIGGCRHHAHPWADLILSDPAPAGLMQGQFTSSAMEAVEPPVESLRTRFIVTRS